MRCSNICNDLFQLLLLLGGAVFPPLLNYLLSRTGFRWTLRILSLIVALGGGISLLGVKPRVPVAIVPHSTTERLHPERRTSNFGFILEIIPDFSFAKSPLFTIIVSQDNYATPPGFSNCTEYCVRDSRISLLYSGFIFAFLRSVCGSFTSERNPSVVCLQSVRCHRCVLLFKPFNISK